MVFNGYDFSQYWRVQRQPALMPMIDVIERTIPGAPGAQFVRADLQPIDIPVEMRLKLPECMTDTTTVNYIKREAAKALYTTEPAELMFYEEPDVRYLAICADSTEFDTPVFTGACEVTFHCCDPHAYYQFKRVRNVVNGTNTFDVAGSAEIWPIFDLVTSAVSEVKITNSDGLFIQCKGPFSDGGRLQVDAQKGFVFKNGVLSQYSLTSDFFRLAPGENTVTFSGIKSGTVTFAERRV